MEMIPPAQRWRTAWVLGLVLMIGAARAGAAVPAALTADSVQQLVVVEDNAQFLTQVALMAGQVPQIKTLTSDQQSAPTAATEQQLKELHIRVALKS